MHFLKLLIIIINVHYNFSFILTIFCPTIIYFDTLSNSFFQFWKFTRRMFLFNNVSNFKHVDTIIKDIRTISIVTDQLGQYTRSLKDLINIYLKQVSLFFFNLVIKLIIYIVSLVMNLETLVIPLNMSKTY